MPFHIYFEIAAFISAAIVWMYGKSGYLKWFAPYLLFIVLVELAGWYFPEKRYKDITWVFNISVPVEYLFYSFIFFSAISQRWIKKLIVVFMIVFVGYVGWYAFKYPIKQFNTRYLLIGSFTMIVWSILYFFDTYRKSEARSFFSDPMFWIAIGIFLFNAGEFSYDLLSSYVATNNLDPQVQLFWSINRKLNILLYILISVGLLCQMIYTKYRKNYRAI